MPLNKTRVIPRGWSEHHRPVAEGTMTGTIRFVRVAGGPEPWPPPENSSPQNTLWEGACRVQELKRTNTTVPGQQPTYTREYLVTLPISTPEFRTGERGDVGTILTSNDPLFPGRVLRVIDVQHGSEMWERDLVCVDNMTQNNP